MTPSAESSVRSRNLSEVLSELDRNSSRVQALEAELQSIRKEIQSRDLILSPRLSGAGTYEYNNRAQVRAPDSQDIRGLEMGMEKAFSTGTHLSAGWGYDWSDPLSSSARHLPNWEVSVEQSLWRDVFGRSTRLRKKEELAELRARELEILGLRQMAFVDVEGLYWDLALARLSEEIRRENLKRSVELESWIQRRLKRSAAERNDVLQVKALVSTRRLELLAIEAEVARLEKRMAAEVRSLPAGSWRPDTKEILISRPWESLWVPANQDKSGSQTPLLIAAAKEIALLDRRRAALMRVQDELNPRLEAFGSYGQSGLDARFSRALEESLETNFRFYEVGLRFNLDLGFSSKQSKRESAEQAMLSQQNRAEYFQAVSASTWKELEEDFRNLQERAKIASTLSEIQRQKSQEERRRYEQGRSTAFQAITFEVEAAQAALDVFEANHQLRKLESRAREFMRGGAE